MCWVLGSHKHARELQHPQIRFNGISVLMVMNKQQERIYKVILSALTLVEHYINIHTGTMNTSYIVFTIQCYKPAASTKDTFLSKYNV